MNRQKLIYLFTGYKELAPYAEKLTDAFLAANTECDQDYGDQEIFECVYYILEEVIDDLVGEEVREDNQRMSDQLIEAADIISLSLGYNMDDLLKVMDLLTD